MNGAGMGETGAMAEGQPQILFSGLMFFITNMFLSNTVGIITSNEKCDVKEPHPHPTMLFSPSPGMNGKINQVAD